MPDKANLQDIRQPVVNGRFYVNDPGALAREVQGYLAQAAEHAGPCAGREPLGLMLPHAGYMFSGAVAGMTLGQVKLPERVILLAPSHTGEGANLAVWPGGAWRTPLGDLPVDEELVSELLKSPEGGFKADKKAHLREHSLEVLLPFVQVARPDAKIVAVSVREYDLEQLRRSGLALAGLMRSRAAVGEKICLIASSDMSHYLPHKEGQRQDALALEQARNLDAEGLFRTVISRRISMCGFAPVSMMIFACRELGATECCITAHTSSGITGKAFGADMNSVVGYAGAIIPAP